MVKEYLELKKKLPQAITFPPTQPIGEASGKEEEYEEEEEDESIGEIAKKYLNRPNTDQTFGVRKIDGHHYIGNKHIIIKDDDIIVGSDKFVGTRGLWELITFKNLDKSDYDKIDYKDYEKLMIKTNALDHDNNPKKTYPKSSGSDKWNELLSPMWKKYNKKGYEGKGVVVIPSDPNALLKRLDLLLASQEAGHSGVGNELVSICDELKRQGVLDTNAYKKLNSLIKLEALERLYRSTGLIFLQWQKKFLTIIIQSLHFSSLKKKGMEKTCEKRRKKW